MGIEWAIFLPDWIKKECWSLPSKPAHRKITQVTTRPAHRPSRRAQLLSAAISELADVGPDNGTMAQIAARAQMTPAAVYYHFKSKEEVLDQIYDDLHAKWLALLEPTIDEIAIDQWIEGFLARCAQWMREEPDETRFLFLVGDAFGGYSRNRRRELVRRNIGLFAAAYRGKCPDVPRLDSVMRASAVLTLIGELARTAFERRKLVPKDFQTQVAGAVIVANRILQPEFEIVEVS